MFLFLGILAGFLIPFQTSINTQLKSYKEATFLATIISFTGGLLLTTLVLLIRGESLFPSISNWGYVLISGASGVIFVSGSIFIFSKLGATQTAILPVVGQVTSGLLVDHFGLFESALNPITVTKLFGAFLVLMGVIGVVYNGSQSTAQTTKTHYTLFIQLFGISLGVFSTLQTAIGSSLGVSMGSAFQSAYLSFVIGVPLLIMLALFKREPFQHLYTKSAPWWAHLGGVIGFNFVLTTIIITPVISTSMTVLTTLLGLMMGSLVIDTLGVFGTSKKPLTTQKIIALFLLVSGVAITQFL